jgi:hypothetical protein
VITCRRLPAASRTRCAARLRRHAGHGGCMKRRSSACCWLSFAQLPRPALTRPAVTGHLPSSCRTHSTSQHVTTVRASTLSRAVRQPSDDACPTHCQIQTWISSSHPRVSAALRPFAGPAHSGRHRQPASDGPGSVPARPIPLFRRIYRIVDP